MGRYLRGTKGFSYKYIYAEQDANLRDLADAAEASRGGLEPLLSASMDALERTEDLPVMELLRAAVRRAGAVGGETRAILGRGNLIHPDSFEFVMYAVAESIVPLAAVLDEKLEAPAQQVELGRASSAAARKSCGRSRPARRFCERIATGAVTLLRRILLACGVRIAAPGLDRGARGASPRQDGPALASPVSMSVDTAVLPQSKRDADTDRRPKSIVLSSPTAGMLWFGGWLFTIAFAQLGFWKAVLALIIWPYFLGVLAR